MTPQTIWPVHQFTPFEQKWQLRGAAKTGGASMSGLTQATRSEGGGYWACEQGQIILGTADKIRAWRALEVLLDGGATPFIMQMCDPRQRPDVIVSGVAVKSHTVPHVDSDDVETSFSDGSLYESVPIVARVTALAALRATTLQIEVNTALRGGEHFSLQHATQGHRLYRVRTVEAVAGDVQTITIRPPLREAISPTELVLGMRADFNNPLCVMRLADPDQMAISVEGFKRAPARVTFVEHFG